jgi:hypothetical protein
MQCRFSNPLTEEQLWMVLDGEADSTIEHHLAECPGCSSRLLRLQRLVGGLKNTLHRYDCPTPDQLADFHLNLLGKAENNTLASHLDICASCREEINLLETLLKADSKTIKLAEQPVFRLPHLREIVATLLPRSLDPAYAVRGEETNKMTAQADGVTIFIEVESLPEGFTLTGQLLDAEQDQWNEALVEIRANDTVLNALKLDDMGEFRCPALPSGTASLRITASNGRTVMVNNINL